MMNPTRAHQLGQTLSALIAAERMSIAFIMRAGGLSRLTVEHLRDGKTINPTRRTLSRVARALSTDPTSLILDRQKMNTTERTLYVAAGYADPSPHDVESMLELLLYYRLGSLERARAWASTIERLASLDVDAVRMLAPQGGSVAPES